MARALTTKEFVLKARKIHGDKYGYNSVKYVRSTDKIVIVCPEHGEFKQKATGHMQGYGCIKCVGLARLTTDEFIKRARVVHGDKYEYPDEYVSIKEKIKIICSEHGYFEQKPKGHLEGYGCFKCGVESAIDNRKLSVVDFLSRAIEAHGDRYDYSLVKYAGGKARITVICPDHGEFKQRAGNHAMGQGCPRCANESVSNYLRSGIEDFISKSVDVHGDKYDYSLVKYVTAEHKVVIVCPEHGRFKQTPRCHTSGRGCAKCGRIRTNNTARDKRTGWKHSDWAKAGTLSSNFDSFKVYVIKCWNEKETFYKIGRTFNRVSFRFSGVKNMPYSYVVIKAIEGDAKTICGLERFLQMENKEHSYTPKVEFRGMYECFSSIIEIRQYLEL